MSLIADFEKLNLTLKSVLLSVATMMPFWYLSIYLFSQNFYPHAPIQMPIVLAFCMSIQSLIYTLFILVIASNSFKNDLPMTFYTAELLAIATAINMGIISLTIFFELHNPIGLQMFVEKSFLAWLLLIPLFVTAKSVLALKSA